MPAAFASSIAYWISGLSTTVSISFGIALVAGSVRVPSPPPGTPPCGRAVCIELLDARLAADTIATRSAAAGKELRPPDCAR